MRRILAVLVLGSVALGACGSGDVGVQTAAGTVAEIPEAARAGGITPVDVVVDANESSVFDVVSAFELNHIPDAKRWAREVVAYRPYDTDDLTLSRLRAALAKHDPPPGVVDQIVASLSL